MRASRRQYAGSGASATSSAPATGSTIRIVVSQWFIAAARKTTARMASPPASASAYERTSPFCARPSSREPRPAPPVTAASEPAISGRSTNA